MFKKPSEHLSNKYRDWLEILWTPFALFWSRRWNLSTPSVIFESHREIFGDVWKSFWIFRKSSEAIYKSLEIHVLWRRKISFILLNRSWQVYQCIPGSILAWPAWCHIWELCLMLFLPCSESFLEVLQISFLHKKQHSKFKFDQGSVSWKCWKLSGPTKPFLGHLEKCITETFCMKGLLAKLKKR